ncbi:hypothetical protein PV10_03637 [Exophiala mesophila]|uniref:Mitochondrial distribution and morphology protein 12 n=1 Tax=Exophiala mesophila TaxID=212818 RepID=A0A0D1X2V1_EXOME|nr:uncharacterized protein PV10_03637 [Exophiala mesophila]KIV96055.1 hypothetical protein PV10_03637 [Exophiala mesophila]
MSVDIGWNNITSGSDGEALAEKIREFVHDKFQQVTLPRFINSVHVHSFEFGAACPDIEIKDICDPLPDFYEDEDEDEDEIERVDADGRDSSSSQADDKVPVLDAATRPSISQSAPIDQLPDSKSTAGLHALHHARGNQFLPDADISPLRANLFPRESLGVSADPSAPFPRSTTPGIPGGTSNLNYFHFPGTGLSGSHTPLAAVASGTPFTPRTWLHDNPSNILHTHPAADHATTRSRPVDAVSAAHRDPSTRPSTANSLSSPRGSESGLSSPKLAYTTVPVDSALGDDAPLDHQASLAKAILHTRHPSDLQVVARVKYSGNVRMTLTAEILLDYPMPSFVGIPLKLAITGMSFDGVSITAWIKRKLHFCFLDPEDAAALTGDHPPTDVPKEKAPKDLTRANRAGLLQEIHVESEIGRQEDGKQVLKNVGKVEKFVLEQVRKIFEEEFVYPSYWTFLV